MVGVRLGISLQLLTRRFCTKTTDGSHHTLQTGDMVFDTLLSGTGDFGVSILSILGILMMIFLRLWVGVWLGYFCRFGMVCLAGGDLVGLV